ncbi:hypothetical protein [Bryobacter aggregatus]|uniref:NHL domain-containing protein n=1 Tax=Bryobacter aggregatus TaxID=360054 RepID=UPI00068AD333|nr:hypothetical protein [Bryobacter aggregatus]
MLLNRIVLALSLCLVSTAQTITTVAGNTSWGRIYNVSVDTAGNIYNADYTKHYVYKTDPFGVVTILAGTGKAGNTGDGGPASSAQVNSPAGTAVAPDGTVYIADSGNDRIRKIAPNGTITTIAGSTAGFSGDGGPAASAKLNAPVSLALDSIGNLYFTDTGNLRLRRINTAGLIHTVAGTGKLSLSGNGGLATAADGAPGWVAIGPDNTVYYTDDSDGRLNGNPRVRQILPNGTVTTIAGTGVSGFSGDGGPATSAQIRSAGGVAVDRNGNIYISDTNDNRVRKVDASGKISTYVGTGSAGASGDGGDATKAQLRSNYGLATDSSGNLYITDYGNIKVRKISPPPFPTIRADGPVYTSFSGNAGFSSNTYLEIYGANLSTTTRLWTGTDFNGANAPTALDGVSVTVNGKPAFIYYISPTQININTPDDTATGAVTLQVKTPLGTSAPVSINRSRLSPTLQTVPLFNVDGKQYVVALTPDFTTYIGRPNMIAGVPFVEAKPGSTVSIYALGCGPTSPPTLAGVVAAQGSSLTLPYQLKIGGVPAEISFAGIVGGTIGLYQFNVIIPSVSAGDQPIELTVDGISNRQNLNIVIGRP